MADLIDRKKAMAEAFTIMIEGEPFEIVQMETLWSLPSEQQWIPIKTRPMTDNERRDYWFRYGYKLTEDEAFIFQCEMPEDGQEVLVCSSYGHIWIDTCENDEEGIGLEENGDWDGVVAWMPLPKPYERSEDE